MKYYCKYCGTIVDDSAINTFAEIVGVECPICAADQLMEPIPDYETPQAYEARTGKLFPDNGLIWIKFESQKPKWYIYTWAIGKELMDKNLIVIVDPPIPPPDDFIL